MSDVVRATCSLCRAFIEVPPAKIRLVLVMAGDQPASAAPLDFFEWPCTRCSGMSHQAAGHSLLRLLLMVGVEPEICEVPAEAMEVHSGPPVSADDVLDFLLDAAATPFLVQEQRRGREFTADDQLGWHVALSRGDYIAAVAGSYGVSGVMIPLSQQVDAEGTR